jgi:hypothetical protein
MQKWEYLTLTAAYAGSDELGIVKMYNNQELQDWKLKRWDVQTALESLGQDGWELVSVAWRKTSDIGFADPVYYFKRPRD